MSEKKYRVAIFASGSGTNAEQIVKYFKGHDAIEIVVIVCNKPSAYVLERAKKLNIPSEVLTNEQFAQSTLPEDCMKKYDVTHIVLAGFLRLLPPSLIRQYKEKIINIHPALLPSYGGKGMYGMKVHEAVKAKGDTKTGITIHLVNEKYDDGRIIFQASCPVSEEDTPEDIAGNVHQLEYRHYPETIERWILNP